MRVQRHSVVPLGFEIVVDWKEVAQPVAVEDVVGFATVVVVAAAADLIHPQTFYQEVTEDSRETAVDWRTAEESWEPYHLPPESWADWMIAGVHFLEKTMTPKIRGWNAATEAGEVTLTRERTTYPC